MNDASESIQIAGRSKIVFRLRKVIDPELGINIIDLGLIYSIDISSVAKEIVIVMTLSVKGCPMGAAISGNIENTLSRHFPDYSHRIELVWSPSWSPEFISAHGREQLES